MRGPVLVIAATLGLSTASWAQETVPVPGEAYEFTVETMVQEVNESGDPIGSASLSPAPAKFTVIRMLDSGNLMIRFWSWPEGSDLRLAFNRTGGDERRYFAVSPTDLSDRAVRIFPKGWSFTAGTILVPVKMRFADFRFSKDITLGPSFGGRWRTSHTNEWFLHTLFSFGITSVSLDSVSTGGSVPQPLDLAAVTPSLGVVMDFDGFQFGVFSGVDLISDNERFNWAYHGEPWLSIGLGYSILSRDTRSTEEETQDDPGA